MAPKTNKKLKGAKKGAKELKEELEAQEQRIAELEYKNEAQLEISRLLMETALIALRDGADIKEFFPLPSFAAYKFIVETKFDEYNKSQPTLKEENEIRVWLINMPLSPRTPEACPPNHPPIPRVNKWLKKIYYYVVVRLGRG